MWRQPLPASATRAGLLAALTAATTLSTGSAGGGFFVAADGARHATAGWFKKTDPLSLKDVAYCGRRGDRHGSGGGASVSGGRRQRGATPARRGKTSSGSLPGLTAPLWTGTTRPARAAGAASIHPRPRGRRRRRGAAPAGQLCGGSPTCRPGWTAPTRRGRPFRGEGEV